MDDVDPMDMHQALKHLAKQPPYLFLILPEVSLNQIAQSLVLGHTLVSMMNDSSNIEAECLSRLSEWHDPHSYNTLMGYGWEVRRHVSTPASVMNASRGQEESDSDNRDGDFETGGGFFGREPTLLSQYSIEMYEKNRKVR